MIIENSTYSNKFNSWMLTPSKRDESLLVCIMKRRLKNLCSKYVSKNLEKYVYGDYTKESFSKEMYEKYSPEARVESDILYLNPALIDAGFQEVFKNYKAKIKQIRKKLKCGRFKGKFIGFSYYTKDTKEHKAGEIKSAMYEKATPDVKKRRANMAAAITYITKFNDLDNIVEYINSVYDKSEEDKKKFYDIVLHYINKFGLERLRKTVDIIKKRAFYKYRNPIVYKSLTINGFSRQYDIITENANKNSKIDAFINLTWIEQRKPIHFPVLYNKKFYGNIDNFNKTKYAYRYTLKPFVNDKGWSDEELLDETGTKVDRDKLKKLGIDKPEVVIILTRKDVREFPDFDESVIGTDAVVGADVNFKHNAVALSDGKNFDWERDLIKKLSDEYKAIDREKRRNPEYVQGKKKTQKIDTIKRQLRAYVETLCVEICKYMQSKNQTHIVFENIDGHFGKTYATDGNDVNLNRILKDIGFADVKNVFEHVARKYGISVSIVPSEYTSQMCTVCWTIDENNRKTQEVYKCVNEECDSPEENADTHGAKVIK